MSRYRMAALLAALVLLFGLAGHMDYEDQQAEQEQYCEMVRERLWPDYRGTYRAECRQPTTGQR